MKLVLKSVENTSYKGQRELALCNEAGDRLPYSQIAIAMDDASGIVNVTVQFKVDGKNVRLE